MILNNIPNCLLAISVGMIVSGLIGAFCLTIGLSVADAVLSSAIAGFFGALITALLVKWDKA